MPHARTVTLPLALVAVLALLTGCGASEEVPTSATDSTGEGATQYPLTVSDCGRDVRFEAPPTRVVSLDQDSTEILLSLGLQDRLVGTASWTDPVLDSLADANASVPRLADNAPSYEVVLGADPDFVTASFGRHFAQGGVATRDRFAETGVATYLSPTDCDGDVSVNAGGTRTTALTVDTLYGEIRDLARIFDVADRGEALVASLQQRAAAATAGADTGGRTVAFWFADTKTPFMAGGYSNAGMLASLTGMTNVFGDRTDDWTAIGWESVVAADPDVLVLGDLERDRFPGDRLDDKIAFLESDPLTRTMTAVRNKSYIALHGAELNPSIRFVDALEKIRAAANAEGSTP